MRGRKPAEKLSRDPQAVRARLRRKHAHMNEDLAMLAGYKPVEEWDLEELAYGRPRAKNGQLTGPKPKWITALVAREAKRRLMDRAFGDLASHLDNAIKAIGDLLTSDEVDEFGRPLVDARTKYAAATFVIEHIIGKPKAVVEVESADLVRQFLAGALVLDDGKPDDHTATRVIEGTLVDDDDDE